MFGLVAPHADARFTRLEMSARTHGLHGQSLLVEGLEEDFLAGRNHEVRTAVRFDRRGLV